MRPLLMRVLLCALVVMAILAPSACGSSGGQAPPTTAVAAGASDTTTTVAEFPEDTTAVPEAFSADPTAGVDLIPGSAGGGIALRSGDATAAVYVPAGAVADGAKWRVTPLSASPSGVSRPLCPGIYVDTAGAEPNEPCSVGFALSGEAPEGATIVRISTYGTSSEIVPTTRLFRDGVTLLTANVDGFSAYTTAEEDKAAIDEAFVERAKARGKQVDWTIKAGGTETQSLEGWDFTYEIDLFASGGDVWQGGRYEGYVNFFVNGVYNGPAPAFVDTFGEVKGSGRDDALSFYIVDAPLASLLTGESVGEPLVCGAGVAHLEGLASLNMSAQAPNVSGNYDTGDVSATDATPFTIIVNGEDVQLEIPNVGIFPGKILRTTK